MTHPILDLTMPFATPAITVARNVSPLRYPGGKRRLAPFVAALARSCESPPTVVVEPFAGGAAMSISLLESNVVQEAVLNDFDPIVHAFWSTVFSDQAHLLAERIAGTVPTLAEWQKQKALVADDMLDAAFQFLFLNRTSFSGSMAVGAGPIGGMAQTGPYKVDCRFNSEGLAKRIMALALLKDRVRSVGCASYFEMAERSERIGGRNALWYLDPPFFAKANKLYRRFFLMEDHERLRASLDDISGRFVLSYDDCEDARRLYGHMAGFHLVAWQHSARVDKLKREDRFEVMVSDIDVAPVFAPLPLLLIAAE